MRTFSDFEKHAMNIIAQIGPELTPSQNLETLVYNLFAGLDVYFEYDPIAKMFYISYYTNDEEDIQTISDISDKLLSLQILLEYLDSLYLVRLYNENINGCKFQDHDKKIEISHKIIDERIKNFFCKNWLSTFIVTEAFKTFVNNDFKTEDQIYDEKTLSEAKKQTDLAKKTFDKSAKQTEYARWTFITSILAIIISIISPLILKSCS